MATAGSGDALTGIITGFLAQGYEPLQATLFAVYLHGRAGDIAVEQTGYQSLTASDIIDGIGFCCHSPSIYVTLPSLCVSPKPRHYQTQ